MLEGIIYQLVLGAVHGVEVVVGTDHDPVPAVAAIQVYGLDGGLETFEDQLGAAAVGVLVAAEAARLQQVFFIAVVIAFRRSFIDSPTSRNNLSRIASCNHNPSANSTMIPRLNNSEGGVPSTPAAKANVDQGIGLSAAAK